MCGGVESGTEPVEDEPGDVVVFADEVRGRFEAVHIGLRQALAQIPQIAFDEHRVLRPPHQQGGAVEGGDVLADALQLGIGCVVVIDRDVGDEAADRPPVLRGGVRGAERGPGLRIEVAEAQRHAQEPIGGHGRRGQHGAGQSGAQRSGHRCVLGLVDGGVEADRGVHDVGVARRPPQGEHTAPIVADRHDRVLRTGRLGVGRRRRGHGRVGTSGRLGEESPDDGVEISDAIADPAHLGGLRGRHRLVGESFGEAHLELVGGDEPPDPAPGAGGVDGLAGQAPPQVRPGRISVEGDDRALGLETGRAQGRQCVEDVECVRPVGTLCLDDPGPGGVPLGQLRGNRGRPCRESH